MICTKAAVTHAPGGGFEISEIAIDQPRDDQVMVEMMATGVCHTDIAAMRGALPVPTPIVLGHEGAGRVIAIGSAVRSVKPGDRVVISFASCGRCRNCSLGAPAYCEDFTALNFARGADAASSGMRAAGRPLHGGFFGQSSFAGLALAAERNVVQVPADIPPEIVAPLGCGVQTGAGAVLNTLKVGVGDSIIISGCGPVGLSAIMAARAAGAAVIVGVDTTEARLEVARELGATHVMRSADVALNDALPGVGPVDFAVDTTGISSVISSVASLVRKRGTVGLIGFARGEQTLTLDVLKGKTFVGIVEGDSVPPVFINHLIAMYRAGVFPVDKLITTYPFGRIDSAILDLEAGRVVKAVLMFDSAAADM